MLETDPAGTGNWQFVRRPGDGLLSPIHARSRPRWARRHAAQEKAGVTLENLRIREGRVAWRDDAGNWTTVEVRRLDAAAPGMEGRGSLTAQIIHAAHTVNITLDTGRLDRLREPTSVAPWPVRLELDTPGAHASIVGTLTDPRELHGYGLAVEGAAENLGDMQGLLHMRLPPLRKLVFKTRLTDSGGVVPIVSSISLRARESDLDAWVPGLSVAALDLVADSFDSPVHAEFDGTFDHRPLHLAAESGPPAALLTPGRMPGRWPVDVNVEVAGGSLAIKGAIAAPETGTGLDLDIAGRMPDLDALSPLIGYRLPAFRNITLGLHAGDAKGGFRQGVVLHDLALHSSEADLAGEMDVSFAQRTAFRAVMNGRNLDIDALRAAIGNTGAPPSSPPTAADTQVGWLIPSDRLPLDGLTRDDLDLHINVAELRLGGTQFHDASLVARLRDGQLTVDPLSATLPGGGIELKGALNVHGRFPPMLLSVRAAGVPARPVLSALGLADNVTGTMSLSADLSSAGASWHELATGLSGQLGFAMSDAELDNRLLETVFGPVLRVDGLSPSGAGATEGRTTRRAAWRCVSTSRTASRRCWILCSIPRRYCCAVREPCSFAMNAWPCVWLPTVPASSQPTPAVRIGGVFTRTTIYPEQSPPPLVARPNALAPQLCAGVSAIASAAMPTFRQP